MTDRDRSNETYIYISKPYKAKLKAYTTNVSKRTMQAEIELWIDSLPKS